MTICHWLSVLCLVLAAVVLVGYLWVSGTPTPERGQTSELVLWGILRDRGIYLAGGFLVAALFLQYDRVVAGLGGKPAKIDDGPNS